MIRKKIWTIWLSLDNKPLSPLIQRCIDSQKIPGYEHEIITLDNCYKGSAYVKEALEKAKSDAIAGKGGKNYGVNFGPNSYVYFSGNSFDPSNSGNVTYLVTSGLSLSNNFSSTGGTVIFSRLTGVPQITGTITVTETKTSHSQNIAVGSLGDISASR